MDVEEVVTLLKQWNLDKVMADTYVWTYLINHIERVHRVW